MDLLRLGVELFLTHGGQNSSVEKAGGGKRMGERLPLKAQWDRPKDHCSTFERKCLEDVLEDVWG